VLGVIGPGERATASNVADAFEVARLAAHAGWVVLTGGRNVGVMDAASRGARSAGGLVVGILPDADARAASSELDVAIVTGLGEMRDHVVVLSSDAIVVCGMSAGTAAEAALAMQARKPLVFLRPDTTVRTFFHGFAPGVLVEADSPAAAMKLLPPAPSAERPGGVPTAAP
jgi:uncharacterized protein (TIGR00725 family)